MKHDASETLERIADAYDKADRRARRFWQSKAGRELLGRSSTAWSLQSQSDRHREFARQVRHP